jgi:hypothetical protein
MSVLSVFNLRGTIPKYLIVSSRGFTRQMAEAREIDFDDFL